ncbi:MAG: hypothetical protein ABSF81_03165 [Bacteroidales bacterium]|jgi:hypothetical protein
MTTDQPKEFLDTLAKIISVIFHPLLMPVYGMAIIFSAPTLFGYLPFTVKKLLFLIMLVNNVLLPLSLLPFFFHRNIISSWSISERKERNIPLIITTILYCATSYIIFRFPIPVFLKSFIFATAFLSLIVTVINFWWKISLHSVGAGALIALVLILSLKMFTPLMWYLIMAILAGGLVLSSRLKLNFHNPQQVWIGIFTGFLGLILFMMFF